jgi:hypothetical protein
MGEQDEATVIPYRLLRINFTPDQWEDGSKRRHLHFALLDPSCTDSRSYVYCTVC